MRGPAAGQPEGGLLARLGLRLRIFLFFAALGLGGVAVATGGLVLGYARLGLPEAAPGFVLAGLVAGFGILGLVALVWLLFDENLARPIERLAAQMRARAHSGADVAVDIEGARYLGDLAPAAAAVSTELSVSTLDRADAVAAATARLAAERDRLTALLTDIPVAMILVNPAHQIVLYDGQAGEALASVAHPRMGASLFDYLDEAALRAAHAALGQAQGEVSARLPSRDGGQNFSARLKPLGHGAPGYLLLLEDTEALIAPEAARPIIYDFDLLDRPASAAHHGLSPDDLTFVVFDTETTGLLPHRDAIVQLAAVRVVRGRIVPGEVIDALVNPGRPIPAAATRVHGVSDAMVADAPDIVTVGRQFHAFARDAVIVAHNAPFDLAFLNRDAAAMGVRFDHPVLDTVLLSAVLFGAGETHTLDALCDRLGVVIPPELRHTALGDARATAEALCAMLPMLVGRGMHSFGDIIAQTRRHGRLLEDMN